MFKSGISYNLTFSLETMGWPAGVVVSKSIRPTRTHGCQVQVKLKNGLSYVRQISHSGSAPRLRTKYCARQAVNQTNRLAKFKYDNLCRLLLYITNVAFIPVQKSIYKGKKDV